MAQPVTESEAARLAREIFHLDASARSLPGEYDDNFHLISTGGPEFVLKIMHPARAQSFVEMKTLPTAPDMSKLYTEKLLP